MFGGTFIELCSPRAAAILGVLAIAIGFFVGSFSTDFYLLALSYGIIIGKLSLGWCIYIISDKMIRKTISF